MPPCDMFKKFFNDRANCFLMIPETDSIPIHNTSSMLMHQSAFLVTESAVLSTPHGHLQQSLVDFIVVECRAY